MPTDTNDRNRAPDTYLSAAPVDSISNSGLVRIPYRYRAQWSGSDVDGEVVGFFVAVTETTVDVTSGRPFRLPPPKPQDYKFTTARESLFTFDVTEGRGTDREHALYVYAVDNQGKVDPTPAVTHFVSRDQNLPGVRFILASAQGTIYRLAPGGGVTPFDSTFTLSDGPELPLHAPRDTIPSGGSVHFGWRGFDNDFGSYITGYRYKLVETDYVHTDSTVKSVDYGTPFSASPGRLPIGLNTFRLIAVDEANGSTQPDSVRQFIVNFSPDTWLSGPDPAALAGHLLVDQYGTYFPTDSTNGRPVPFPGNPMTDTLTILPAERPVTDGLVDPQTGIRRAKTIMEQRTILDRTVRCYIRSEDDTIAFGSLIVARFGGFDKDSPYRISGGSPDSSRVFQSGPPNGSPTGFQARIQYALANGGGLDNPFSTPFPNVDPFDALYNKAILYTIDQIDATGQAFLQFRAVDGDRSADLRIGDARGTYQFLSPEMRSKIFRFYTNFSPELDVISPARDSVMNAAGGNSFQLTVRAFDPDPDPSLPRFSPTYQTMYFSIRARVYADVDSAQIGPEDGWQDPTRSNYVPDVPPFFPFTPPIVLNVVVADDVPSGPAKLEIEVADNTDRLKARIVRVRIPIFWRSM